jgi:anti-sigma factor RsiW
MDLKDQGFPLVGGRLDYLDHRNVAALVYQRQKHFINVFVWPEESSAAKLPEVQTIQGYNLIYWSHDGMNFCAASDLNLAELRQFSQLLQR